MNQRIKNRSFTQSGVSWGLQMHSTGAKFVKVSCQMAPGLPFVSILGVTGRESRDLVLRVSAALQSVGLRFPSRRTIISFENAQSREMSELDLALVCAILQARGLLRAPKALLAWGRVGIDGQISCEISHPSGGIPASEKFLHISTLRESDLSVSHVEELLSRVKVMPIHAKGVPSLPLSPIELSTTGARALQISLTGTHSLLLYGSVSRQQVEAIKNWSSKLKASGNEAFLRLDAVGRSQDLEVLRDIQAEQPLLLWLANLSDWSRSRLLSLDNQLNRLGRVFLVADSQSCPCGRWGMGKVRCRCPRAALERQQNRIPLSLQSRFILRAFTSDHQEGYRLDPKQDFSRLERARDFLQQQFLLQVSDPTSFPPQLPLTPNARSCFQVATTIAALDGSQKVQANHLREARFFARGIMGMVDESFIGQDRLELAEDSGG